jgi:NAD(P)-dependent dehydrogenase (short-subunit alcohol dehydrogenase family)
VSIDRAPRRWSLILGASGGLGGGCARALGQHGYSLLGVHLDTSERLAAAEALAEELRGLGVGAHLFNINAANEAAMRETVAEIADLARDDGGVHVLVHALAFGALAPFIREPPGAEIIGPRQMQMTMNIMAHSLVYWTQALHEARLLARGAKIFALTSMGGGMVIPSYGAVSAAKAALEAHVRQLACELAPYDVSVNAIRAGVTDTPALRLIPGSDALMERSRQFNPYHRLTTPEDVGDAIALLASASSPWMTGNVIGVDGGEKLTL